LLSEFRKWLREHGMRPQFVTATTDIGFAGFHAIMTEREFPSNSPKEPLAVIQKNGRLIPQFLATL